MKKNASKATKPALKNTAAKKQGRGGARPGAGRKKLFDETQQISIDVPTELIQAMEKAGIENKTKYISALIAIDLTESGNVLSEKQKQKIRNLFKL